MIQRIMTAVVLVPLVLLLILRAPATVIAVVAAVVALLAIREFLALVRRHGVEPFSAATYILSAGFFACVARTSFGPSGPADSPAPVMFLYSGLFASLAPFIFLIVGLRRENLSSIYPAAAASVFAFVYIAVPMGLLVALHQGPMGDFRLIYLMLVVWSGDIFAYFVGKSLGRHRMSPRVSPGKTWEGAIASMLASICFGTVFYHFSLPISRWLLHFHFLGQNAILWERHDLAIWRIILLTAALNIGAQLGDLVESVIKRGADVKDSGSILPGHGGMLDRIDALLLAAPVLWFYAVCRPLFL